MTYPRQLTLQMRQRQLQDIYGNDIVYAGSTPYNLNPVPTTVSTDWIDYTEYVDGLDKLELTWSTTQTAQGAIENGEFRPKLGASGTLTFERAAHEFLKSLLVDAVAAPLNQVEVQITDTANGSYTGYTIKSTSLSWCEFNALCTYELNLKQEDIYTQCIERTMIADNWQGWFQTRPVEIAPGITKKHPRFSYCTEHRPNGSMVMQWYLLGITQIFGVIMFIIITAYDILVTVVINPIIAIINAILFAISLVPGIPVPSPVAPLDTPNPLDIFTSIAQLYIESAGCGREHPAPLIRDYISNVCAKCGITVNATTADIFFAPILTVQKSDGLIYDEPNPHYNACYFFPQVKRGIRRFASINLFGTSQQDYTTYWDTNNTPILAGSDLLDQLKHEYNAQWQIRSGAGAIAGTTEYFLYFKRKDFFKNKPPLYDFSLGGADRSKLVEGICYEPQDYTAPASMNGLYRDDPADKCGHENARNMNGDPLSFGNTTVNPLFHGILDKQSAFAASKFRLDGSTGDYIYDALQVLGGNPLLGSLTSVFLFEVANFVRQFADFAILLQGETVTAPKILIWDGKNNDGYGSESNCFLNARAVRDSIFIGASETAVGTEYFIGKTAYDGNGAGVPMPTPNPLYPQQINSINPIPVPPPFVPSTISQVLPWNFVAGGGALGPYASYPPDTHLIGHGLSFIPPVPGKYTVNGFFGVISSQPAILVNFPMFFNPYYQDTMWDWFHWIDDPYRFPLLRKQWRLKIPLCGEDLNKLGLIGDGFEVNLLETVLLDNQYYNNGVITDITVGYDTGNEKGTGQFIELKGYV